MGYFSSDKNKAFCLAFCKMVSLQNILYIYRRFKNDEGLLE